MDLTQNGSLHLNREQVKNLQMLLKISVSKTKWLTNLI